MNKLKPFVEHIKTLSLELCYQIEVSGASEELTVASEMANGLYDEITSFYAELMNDPLTQKQIDNCVTSTPEQVDTGGEICIPEEGMPGPLRCPDCGGLIDIDDDGVKYCVRFGCINYTRLIEKEEVE